MKRNLLTLLLLCVACCAYAQKGNISGHLYDSVQKKDIALATVTVFNAADTSIVTYRLSDDKGDFKIGGLPLNKQLRFLVTYSGYDVYRKEFMLSADKPALSFDPVVMNTSVKDLDAVIIIAERPPVMIKNDTIEFNANAFKTLPNALLEDLLKKLPGVQVSKDGNIMVNGKAVNRILVDGKNFFGGDPKIATRNLPANIIDKVQVSDDKEELARRGDDNVNNIGKVVNITLKKGVKKGVFGKVYAGGGTDHHYESGGIANLFRDTLQLSILGYSNNLNKPGFGFSELMQAGGIERSNSNLNSRSVSMSSTSSGGSSITMNGVNFGGMPSGGGLSKSSGAGINFNHAPDLRRSVFGQYFYGNVKVNKLADMNLLQYNRDTVVKNHTDLNSGSIMNAHNIGLGVKLKPDSVTTIFANANYTIGTQNENANSIVNTDNNYTGLLSTGNVNQHNNLNTHYYKHYISYTRLSKSKKGKRFSIVHNLNVNNGDNNYVTDALTNYVNPSSYDSLLSRREHHIPQIDLNAGFGYRNPYGKNLALVLGTRYDYSRLENEIKTFDPDAVGNFSKINTSLSSDFNRLSHRLSSSAGLEIRIKKLFLTPTIKGLWQQVDNHPAAPAMSVNQNRFDLLPAFSLVYKQLTINYDKSIVLPAYNYLIPVPDISNPYYISTGNTNLVLAEKHNFSSNYNLNNSKTNLYISMYVNGSVTNNDVVQNIKVDGNGVQTASPVNANGSAKATLGYNINKQYKYAKDLSFTFTLGGQYDYEGNKFIYNNSDSRQKGLSASQWANFNLNFNDKVEWEGGYYLVYNTTKFSNNTFNPIHTVQHTIGSQVTVRMPKHFIWEAEVSYDYNGNIPLGFPRDAFRLNTAVNYTMLKDEKGVLRLSAWDLLNRNNNILLNTTRNTTTVSSFNVLKRYFMLSFTYNLRTAGSMKKKVGGQSGIFGY